MLEEESERAVRPEVAAQSRECHACDDRFLDTFAVAYDVLARR